MSCSSFADPARAQPIAALRANPDAAALAQAIHKALNSWVARTPKSRHPVTVKVKGYSYEVIIQPEHPAGQRQVLVYLNWVGQNKMLHTLMDHVLATAQVPVNGPYPPLRREEIVLNPKESTPDPTAGKPAFPFTLPPETPEALAAAMNEALATRAEMPLGASYPSTTLIEPEPGKPRYAVVAQPRGPHGLYLKVFPCWQDAQGQTWSDPSLLLAHYLLPHAQERKVYPADLTLGPEFTTPGEP